MSVRILFLWTTTLAFLFIVANEFMFRDKLLSSHSLSDNNDYFVHINYRRTLTLSYKLRAVVRSENYILGVIHIEEMDLLSDFDPNRVKIIDYGVLVLDRDGTTKAFYVRPETTESNSL